MNKIIMLCGSRGYASMQQVIDYINKDFDRNDILIHGGCSNSPDAWADFAARPLGIIVGVFEFPKGRGKAGGPIRNKVMVNLATSVVAFWDGDSHGTEGVIEYARKIGKPVQIISSAAALRKSHQ